MIKHFILVGFCLFSEAALCQEQPKPYTLVIPPADVQLIWDSLSELPWKKVNPLMQNLQRQILDQQNQKPVEVPEKKE